MIFLKALMGVSITVAAVAQDEPLTKRQSQLWLKCSTSQM